jgi:hypothetical protein
MLFDVLTAMIIMVTAVWKLAPSNGQICRLHCSSAVKIQTVWPFQCSVIYVRFEVATAVIMKNTVACDIKTQFVPHRKHITSPLQSSAS